MTNSKENANIIFLTRELNKLITMDFDKRLDSFGLTSHQGHILFYLNRKTNIEGHEVHQKDIEEEFHLSKSTVSELLKRMEKKGLIIKIGTRPLYKLKPSDEGLKIIDEEERIRIIENMKLMIENMREDK